MVLLSFGVDTMGFGTCVSKRGRSGGWDLGIKIAVLSSIFSTLGCPKLEYLCGFKGH